VLHTSQLHLQREGLHGIISAKGECSSMVKDSPTSIKHVHRRCVIGTV
jgi:hypothetical protein